MLLPPQFEGGTSTEGPRAGSGVAYFDGASLWTAINQQLFKLPTGAGATAESWLTVDSTWGLTRRIAGNGPDIWVAGESRLVKLNRTGEVQFSGGNQTGGVTELLSDGADMWVYDRATGQARRHGGGDGAVTSTINACAPGSDAKGMVFDGANVWVACTPESRLVRISRTATGQVETSQYELSFQPGVLEFDGSHVWAVNESEAGRVARISSKGQVLDQVVLSTQETETPPQVLCLRFDSTYIWALLRYSQDRNVLVKF